MPVDTEATKARIAQWCEWFDLTPPKLMIRKGKIYLNAELHNWADASDISLDWLFMGDVKGLARAYRAQREAVRLISTREQEVLSPNAS